MAGLNRHQQKDLAKHLFLTEKNITRKEIAGRVGSTEQTIGKWANEGKWEELRKSTLTSKEELMAWMYDQIAGIREAIDKNEVITVIAGKIVTKPEKRYATAKEADAINKLAAAIKKLETEAGIAQKVEVGKQFLVWLRSANPDLAMQFLPLYDAFIKDSM
jgi:transcriptional regulator with XRE-family HTH domain